MKYDFENKPRRSFFGLGAWIIVIVLGLGVVGGTGGFVLNLASQPAQVITKTFAADNMIYNYEWFRQQYQDVQAWTKKKQNADIALKSWLENAPDRSEWKIQDRQMYNQLQSISFGLNNQLAQMIADYNARATMANRSVFKGDLPDHIE